MATQLVMEPEENWPESLAAEKRDIPMAILSGTHSGVQQGNITVSRTAPAELSISPKEPKWGSWPAEAYSPTIRRMQGVG